MNEPNRSRVAVLGAGGRAGRAIVREAARRGLPAVAVVRDPRRHADLATEDIEVVEGDALDAGSLAAIIDPSISAIMSAVTPFTVPPRDFSTLDPQFYFRAAAAIRAVAADRRIIVVGLFATLQTVSGGLVMDDADAFPPALRPFVVSHY
jgi:putative NADH-flavin reductase